MTISSGLFWSYLESSSLLFFLGVSRHPTSYFFSVSLLALPLLFAFKNLIPFIWSWWLIPPINYQSLTSNPMQSHYHYQVDTHTQLKHQPHWLLLQVRCCCHITISYVATHLISISSCDISKLLDSVNLIITVTITIHILSSNVSAFHFIIFFLVFLIFRFWRHSPCKLMQVLCESHAARGSGTFLLHQHAIYQKAYSYDCYTHWW